MRFETLIITGVMYIIQSCANLYAAKRKTKPAFNKYLNDVFLFCSFTPLFMNGLYVPITLSVAFLICIFYSCKTFISVLKNKQKLEKNFSLTDTYANYDIKALIITIALLVTSFLFLDGFYFFTSILFILIYKIFQFYKPYGGVSGYRRPGKFYINTPDSY